MSRPGRARMLSGEFKTATPIYGYKKLKNGKLAIDESAGQVIKEIFEMALEGLSPREISGKLFELGYPTPSEYIKLSKGHNTISANRWTVKCVRVILKNEQYTGAYVSGKVRKNYETRKSYHTPKNEWIVIPDKHPAIISKEGFNEVQEITAKSRIKRKNMRKRDYLLQGKIACGCCGYALSYDDSTGNKVYRCHHTLVDSNAECHKMKVSAPELDEAVMFMIKQQAEVVLSDKGSLQMMSSGEVKQKNSEYIKLITKFKNHLKECYENYITEMIDYELYLSQMNEYTAKTTCWSTISRF